MPAPPRSTLLLAGLALASFGIAGTIARFALFPLDMGLSSLGRALVTGALIGAILGGIQMTRLPRRATERAKPLAVVAAMLGGAALAAGLALTLAPRGAATGLAARATGDELPLHDHPLPGLTISLPPWEVERSATDDPRDGLLALADPGGRDRRLELKWTVTEPLSRDLLVGMFERDEIGLHTVEPVVVAGTDTEIFYFEAPQATKRVAVTQWVCPDDPRAFVLIDFLTLDRPALLRLHRRVLESVRCGPAIDPAALRPRWPELDGDDLTRQQTPTGMLHQTPQGEGFLYTAGSHEPNLVTVFDMDATTRRSIMAGLGLQPVADAFTNPPVHHGDPPRAVWRGTVTDAQSAESFEMLVTAFACPDVGLSYIGMYFPASTIAEDAAQRLASARCPQ